MRQADLLKVPCWVVGRVRDDPQFLRSGEGRFERNEMRVVERGDADVDRRVDRVRAGDVEWGVTLWLWVEGDVE